MYSLSFYENSLEYSAWQATGRKVLFVLARAGQSSLDELTQVAYTFGLRAIDVAEAIARRFC
jgi:hypothetical protein